MISVAIAISNTYKKRGELQYAKPLAKVLKRQSNTCGVSQSFYGEDCKNNLCIVMTSVVAEGITVVASKHGGQRVNENGFFALCTLLCMSE